MARDTFLPFPMLTFPMINEFFSERGRLGRDAGVKYDCRQREAFKALSGGWAAHEAIEVTAAAGKTTSLPI